MPDLILPGKNYETDNIISYYISSVCTIAKAEELRLDLIFSNDMHGGIDRSEATFINPDFPPLLEEEVLLLL